MKKLDEMDRNIQLRSEEWGYRVVTLALGVWTLFNCWQTLAYGAAYRPLPGFILCFAVCVQSFSQLAMKRRMVAGDEEYREPNRLLWTVIMGGIAAAVVVSVGTFFLLKV